MVRLEPTTNSGRLRKAAPLPLPLTASAAPSSLLDSPNEKNASRSPALPPRHGLNGSPASPATTKPRPTTALPLASTATLDALIRAGSTHRLDSDVSPKPRPETAQPRPIKAFIAPLESPASPKSFQPRCAGCGGRADMCLSCFSVFKEKDGVRYKAQLVRSVDSLFSKAVARAGTRTSELVVLFSFTLWRGVTARNKRRRAATELLIHRRRIQRLWTVWQRFVFERRIIGAMLYAENQQLVTRDRNREVAQLQGEVFTLHSDSKVQAQLQLDALEERQHQYETLQQNLAAKDKELVAIRKELRESRAKIASLETRVIDPLELERLRVESVDYKKISFQLLTALFQHLDGQVELLISGEGRYNLAHVFSKDMVQAMDKPETPAFYNPLADLETASACTEVDAASKSSAAPSGGSTTSFHTYEAAVDRADKLIMQWVNSMVAKQPTDWLLAPRMVNFHSSLSDGRILGVISKLLHSSMSRVRLKRPAGTAPSKLEATSVLRENGEDLTEIAMERYLERMRGESSAEKRLELMINTIGQALWMPLGLIQTKDILAGDVELNFAALAYCFCTCSPFLEDSHYIMANDLKQQLVAVKTKWRELKDGKPAVSETSTRGSFVQPGGSTAIASSGDDNSLSARMKVALSHTLELKRKIDAEDQKAHEGHVQWLKAMRIIMRKCFLSYARLARGQVGVLAKLEAVKGDENAAFSKIPKYKLQDIQLPHEDFAWESKLLQTYLVTVYCDLARIYRGYATRGGVANDVITLGDFTQLLVDCRALEGGMSEVDLHAVFKRMDPAMVRALNPQFSTMLSTHSTYHVSRCQTSINPHRALPPLEFLEALVRVARRKYPAEYALLHLLAREIPLLTAPGAPGLNA